MFVLGFFFLAFETVSQLFDFIVLQVVRRHILLHPVYGKHLVQLALVNKDAKSLDANDGYACLPIALSENNAQDGEHDHLLHDETHVGKRLDFGVQPTLADVLNGVDIADVVLVDHVLVQEVKTAEECHDGGHLCKDYDDEKLNGNEGNLLADVEVPLVLVHAQGALHLLKLYLLVCLVLLADIAVENEDDNSLVQLVTQVEDQEARTNEGG